MKTVFFDFNNMLDAKKALTTLKEAGLQAHLDISEKNRAEFATEITPWFSHYSGILPTLTFARRKQSRPLADGYPGQAHTMVQGMGFFDSTSDFPVARLYVRIQEDLNEKVKNLLSGLDGLRDNRLN